MFKFGEKAFQAYPNILVNNGTWLERPFIQFKFFTVDQNVGKRQKCIPTKFELSMSSCYLDIAVQS